MPSVDELMGGARAVVLEGDCREILPTITGQVDHVVTDPPYEADCHTSSRRVLRGAKFSAGEEAVVEPLTFGAMDEDFRVFLGGEFGRLTKRWALVFCQVEAATLWRDAMCPPLDYVRTQIWVKPDGMPQITGDRPGMGYESICTAHATGRKKWNGGGRHGVYTHAKGQPPGERSLHQTQKPLDLMLELVELFTSPNDLILDPFSGSATTAIAALRLGRRCLCIERDPKYAQLSRDRIAAELSSSTLQAYRSGQLPLLR